MRKNAEGKNLNSIPARDILLDILHAKSVLQKLKKRGVAYEPLLDLLIAIEEDDPLPRSKELQIKYGLKPVKLRMWIDQLHTDFLHAIRTDATMLPDYEEKILLFVKGNRDFISVACRLPHLPRVGEEFRIPFVRNTVGSDSFYVSRITYELIDSTIEIHVWLIDGTYNQHYEYLKHQARFENELDFMEEDSMSKYQLERFLREIYK